MLLQSTQADSLQCSSNGSLHLPELVKGRYLEPRSLHCWQVQTTHLPTLKQQRGQIFHSWHHLVEVWTHHTHTTVSHFKVRKLLSVQLQNLLWICQQCKLLGSRHLPFPRSGKCSDLVSLKDWVQGARVVFFFFVLGECLWHLYILMPSGFFHEFRKMWQKNCSWIHCSSIVPLNWIQGEFCFVNLRPTGVQIGCRTKEGEQAGMFLQNSLLQIQNTGSLSHRACVVHWQEIKLVSYSNGPREEPHLGRGWEVWQW